MSLMSGAPRSVLPGALVKFTLTRRSVQSQAEYALFPLDNLVRTALDNTFSASVFVVSLLTNEARNEQSWLVINLGCNASACFWRRCGRAAVEESRADRLSGKRPCFHFGDCDERISR